MVIMLVIVLLTVAFFTLLERKFLRYSQTRVGPNKVTFIGLLQAVLDGGKLLIKEFMSPSQSSLLIFLILPSLFFMFIAFIWSILEGYFKITSNFQGGLVIMIILGLAVYSTLLVGVSSFSKFGAVGGIRAASQSIRYEISLSLILFWRFYCWKSFHLSYTISSPWSLFFFIYLFTLVADVNRAPFDFAEGESELIRGFNIEYGSLPFTLVFLGEYGIILGLSFLISSFFSENYYLWGLLFSSVIIFLRRTLPRFRYDSLIGVSWFFLLPLRITVIFLSMCIN